MKRDSLKWSEAAWAEIENIYQSILSMPFVTELAAGTLSKERFQFYIAQDALYIESYSALLANIASRLQRKDHVESFVRFALDGIEVERLMHAGFLTGIDIESVTMTPTNLLYSSLLRAQVLAPVEVEAAAVLPCFWIYQRVGEDILSKSNQATNPYAKWIATYADASFADSTRRAIEICDQLAEDTGEETRRAMTDIFVKCAKMEWMFWNSAYKMEQWEI